MKSDNYPFSRLPAVGLIVALFAVSACNTIEGAGEDIEAAGDGIEHAAEDTKEKMKN